MGGLRGHGDDDRGGDDGRCAECGRARAVGPCAACEAMICPDCGVMSSDPGGQAVICTSCARLIAHVGAAARPARRRGGVRLIAVAVVVAFGLGLLSLF